MPTIKGMPPRNCLTCSGTAPTRTIISKFSHVDYGHVACKLCGITFDDNVNEFLDFKPDASDIRDISKESEYRKLFIETSTIAGENGDVYSSFDWEDNSDVREGVVRHVLDALAKRKTITDYQDILDLGCGTGFTTVELSKKMPGTRLIAVDPSPEVTKVDGQNGIRAIQGTLDSLHFPAQSFDAVVIIGNLMLHYNPQKTLDDAFQALRPGGVLVIDFKNIEASLRKSLKLLSIFHLQKIIPKSLLDRSFLNMRFGFNRAYIKNMATNIGYELTEQYSKPPRLIEFKNRSHHQSGIKGIIWRSSNAWDAATDQQAWIQMTFVKPANEQSGT